MVTRKTVLDLVREYGVPVPIEEIYASNVISQQEFEQELQRQLREKKARNNGEAISEMERDADILNDRLRKSRVPERYVDCAVDLTHETDLAIGKWFYVCGDDDDMVGIRAASIIKGWLAGGPFRTARYARSTAVLSGFRDTDDTESIGYLSHVGLLCISGLGMEAPTDAAIGKLWELLDMRSGSALPTIIATSSKPESLAAHFSSRGNEDAARKIVGMLKKRSVLIEV